MNWRVQKLIYLWPASANKWTCRKHCVECEHTSVTPESQTSALTELNQHTETLMTGFGQLEKEGCSEFEVKTNRKDFNERAVLEMNFTLRSSGSLVVLKTVFSSWWLTKVRFAHNNSDVVQKIIPADSFSIKKMDLFFQQSVCYFSPDWCTPDNQHRFHIIILFHQHPRNKLV